MTHLRLWNVAIDVFAREMGSASPLAGIGKLSVLSRKQTQISLPASDDGGLDPAMLT